MGTEQVSKVIVETWGIAGAFIVALAIYIMYLHNTHRKEREEWKLACQANQQAVLEMAKNNTEYMGEIIKSNTDVLSGIKVLVESMERRGRR